MNSQTVSSHRDEIEAGQRFAFGENWSRFLRVLDDTRIANARHALRGLLGQADFSGQTFFDIGSGSGLMSLVARQLGMKVVSIDYDPGSVACTMELRRRYFEGDPDWSIIEGSALDPGFLANLGKADVVYSWGVLHHTGEMWRGLDLVSGLAADGALLIVSIYNDQGPWSKVWRKLKRTYNALPAWLRLPYVVTIMSLREVRIALVPFLKGKFHYYFRLWTEPGPRGMSRWYDWLDWIGGYPFEVAKPEEVFEFFRVRGFTLLKLKTCAGELGCNEYVLKFDRRAQV